MLSAGQLTTRTINSFCIGDHSTKLRNVEPPGAYLSPDIIQQQHRQLHQLSDAQFQGLHREQHQQMQLRLQTQHQQQHHHHHQQMRASSSDMVDEDACFASSSYNSPTGSIANQSLASTSSDNQLDSAGSASAPASGGSAGGAPSSSSSSSSAGAANAGLLPHRKRRYKVQMPEAEEPFLCHVCGDRALGYNFDAVTCESCKAFFRRNALKKKEQKCNFSGACDVTINTRKFCSACRLKKCFRIGMKKDWILNESELQQRREKTRCNRETRVGVTPTQAPPCPSPAQSLTPPIQQQQMSMQLPILKLESSLNCFANGSGVGGVSRNFHAQQAPPPPPPPPPPPNPSTPQLEPHSRQSFFPSISPISPLPPHPPPPPPSSLDTVERPSVLAFMCENEPEPEVPRWTGGRPLSPASAAIIGVIRCALDEVMNNVDSQDSTEIQSTANAPVTLEAPFAITLSFVQRFVLFIKRLPEYSLIDQPDMVNLIKGGVFHFILMRGVSIYNPADNTFSFESNRLGGHHTLSLACLAQSLSVYPNGEQLLSRYKRFMTDYHHVSRGDQLALTLLQLIEFYNPARPNLANMHRVDRVQQGYILLLWRYVQHSFPQHLARGVYFDLMNRLSELEILASEFSQLCHIVGFRYEELNPLLIEVFELHQQRQQQQRQQQSQAEVHRSDVETSGSGDVPPNLKCEPATPHWNL